MVPKFSEVPQDPAARTRNFNLQLLLLETGSLEMDCFNRGAMGRRCNYQQLSPWAQVGRAWECYYSLVSTEKKLDRRGMNWLLLCLKKKKTCFDSDKEVLPPLASQRISSLEVDVSQPQNGSQAHQHTHSWIKVSFSFLDAVYNYSWSLDNKFGCNAPLTIVIPKNSQVPLGQQFPTNSPPNAQI